jgi:acyl-CoA thioester hydrolase
MENNDNFKHSTPVEIRFADIDAFGHVNNAKHFTYMEQARISYFNQVAGQKVEWSKQGVILARATMDYKLPIFLKDTLVVYTRCSKIGSKSFDLEAMLTRKTQDNRIEVVAMGTTILVAYDYQKGKAIQVPDEWRKSLSEFEKRNLS